MIIRQNGHTGVGMNKISSCFRLLLNGEEQDFLELGTKSKVVLELKSRIVCVVHRKNLKWSRLQASFLHLVAHFLGCCNPNLLAYFCYLHFSSLTTRILR